MKVIHGRYKFILFKLSIHIHVMLVNKL